MPRYGASWVVWRQDGRGHRHQSHPMHERKCIFCGGRRNGHKWWEQVELKGTLCMSGRLWLEILQLQEEEGLGESTRAAQSLSAAAFPSRKRKKNPPIYNFHPLLPRCLCILFLLLPFTRLPLIEYCSNAPACNLNSWSSGQTDIYSCASLAEKKSSIMGFFSVEVFFFFFLCLARLMFPFKRISILISPS